MRKMLILAGLVCTLLVSSCSLLSAGGRDKTTDPDAAGHLVTEEDQGVTLNQITVLRIGMTIGEVFDALGNPGFLGASVPSFLCAAAEGGDYFFYDLDPLEGYDFVGLTAVVYYPPEGEPQWVFPPDKKGQPFRPPWVEHWAREEQTRD